MRRIAIGDIHGCAKALRTLIETIAPRRHDELIFLGDYVDRGPDSRNVVDQILELSSRCRVIALRGNHEIMLQGVAFGGLDDQVWLANGGQATVSSYGGSLSKMPSDHLTFFQDLLPYYETSTDIFVHAGYHADRPMHLQDDMMIYWAHLGLPLPKPHCSGKRVFVGHTPQPDDRILDVGHLVCLDTYCFGGGTLTAYEVGSGDITQVSRHGHVRKAPFAKAADQVKKMGTRVTEFCRQALSRSEPARTNDATVPDATQLASEPDNL